MRMGLDNALALVLLTVQLVAQDRHCNMCWMRCSLMQRKRISSSLLITPSYPRISLHYPHMQIHTHTYLLVSIHVQFCFTFDSPLPRSPLYRANHAAHTWKLCLAGDSSRSSTAQERPTCTMTGPIDCFHDSGQNTYLVMAVAAAAGAGAGWRWRWRWRWRQRW